ncbi:hypothetical protein MY10362_009157 [Beauveria mimosiformis]
MQSYIERFLATSVVTEKVMSYLPPSDVSAFLAIGGLYYRTRKSVRDMYTSMTGPNIVHETWYSDIRTHGGMIILAGKDIYKYRKMLERTPNDWKGVTHNEKLTIWVMSINTQRLMNKYSDMLRDVPRSATVYVRPDNTTFAGISTTVSRRRGGVSAEGAHRSRDCEGTLCNSGVSIETVINPVMSMWPKCRRKWYEDTSKLWYTIGYTHNNSVRMIYPNSHSCSCHYVDVNIIGMQELYKFLKKV